MEHVAGLRSSASARMSPGALALAVLLHVAAAVALWWMTVNRPPIPPVEEAIEITIEKPKPPEPPPPPPPEPKAQPQPQPKPQPQAQPKPQPAPPLQGLPPPAEITADKRTQVAPSGDQPKDIAGPPPRSLDMPVPEPQPPAQVAAAEPSKPKEPPPLEQAAPPPAPAEPPKPKEPPPPLEQAVPLPPPAPAVASLPPPPKEPPPPQPVTPKPPPPAPAVTAVTPTPPRPQTPPAVTPHPQPRPTPLIARPQERPPAIANRNTPPSSSPFVNPADARNRALAGDNYRWQIIRKLSGYRFSTQSPVRESHLVIRIVIARDGRLLAAEMLQSSGIAAVDQGALNGIRAGSPYTPLPPEIGGDSAPFVLPLVSVPVGY